MRTWITLALLGVALIGAPGEAQPPRSTGSQTAPVTDPEAQRKLDEMQMEFLNTDGAIWVNRSINDTVYWSGYSPNLVFGERDMARVEAAMQRLAGGNKVEALTISPSNKTAEYELNINGKVVPVEALP